MNDEEDWKLIGDDEKTNYYLESMIRFFRNGQGNLYKWVLTLPTDDIFKFSLRDDEEDYSEEFSMIAAKIAVLAFSIERGRKSKSFDTSLNELGDAIGSFKVMCILALSEKYKVNKIVDKSFFFDPSANLEISVL